MSANPNDTTCQGLKDRLRAIITTDFEDLGAEQVARVLDDVAGELRAPGPSSDDATKAPVDWPGNLTNEISQPASPSSQRREAGVLRVTVEASSPVEVASLLHQALEVGALLIDFDDPPTLNELVRMELAFPDSQFSVETQGRVVHTSASATAVEVAQLSREDRAALATILKDHRNHRSRDSRPPQSPKQATPRQASSAQASSAQASSAEFGDQTSSDDRRPHAGGRDRPAHSETSANGQRSGFAAGSSRDARPGSSVVIGALNPRRAKTQRGVRREVELTDPDLRVLSSTRRAIDADRWSGRTFGPEPTWIEPNRHPDRVETLADERILDVLLQLSGGGFTGLLEIETDTWQRQAYFEGGLIVDITRKPRQPSEELGPMLYVADRIDDQQLAMAAAHSEENDTTFERSLLELELLDYSRIRHAIASRLTYLIRTTCGLKSGTIRVFDSKSLPAGYLPAPPLRVHVPVERIIYASLFEQLKQQETAARDRRIAERIDAYPEIPDHDLDRVQRAVLSDQHTQLVDQIAHGRRRLREVFTESNLAPAESFAVIYSLHRMGVLRFDTSLHHTIVRERFRENVTVKHLSVHKASYFEVLNVHWSSYDEVIEKAYRELSEQFDPTAVPDAMEPEVHERVDEISERIDSAYQILAEREKRHGYRKRIMPEYKLTHALPLFLKQAELAERRSQWDETIDSLRRVLELDPDHEQAALRMERVEQMRDGRLSADAAESNF